MTAIVLPGDCRKIIAGLADQSIDAIVTDPPYELGFMGKRWDASGVAYDVDLWAECLRVLKPGGHLLAFGGTRTYHRMTVAIEDAGFEIRDSIHWLYGSGFPKSLDVSKALDKMAGAERAVVGKHPKPGSTSPRTSMGDGWQSSLDITAPATDAARQWEGWGTALKPAHEPIVVARKPLSGTVAANVLAHGTGALNIDGCRVAGVVPQVTQGVSQTEGTWRGPRTAPRESQPHDAGRWPANLVFTHAADCGDTCADGCPVSELDAQSGVSSSRVGKPRKSSKPGDGYGMTHTGAEHNDSGGASRFFTVTGWDPFFYTAKPSRRERNADDTVNNRHPTVKPLALMRWLVRLVTPPGGTVLDPFAGSGTTLAAAILEGFDAIGCEMTDDYLPIIDGRIAWAEAERAKTDPTLFGYRR